MSADRFLTTIYQYYQVCMKKWKPSNPPKLNYMKLIFYRMKFLGFGNLQILSTRALATCFAEKQMKELLDRLSTVSPGTILILLDKEIICDKRRGEAADEDYNSSSSRDISVTARLNDPAVMEMGQQRNIL